MTAEPKSILSLKGASAAGWGDASDHVRNLLNCIRSRTPTICNPEVAHRAITICQAWTISLRLGRKLKWDPVKERFDVEEANRMLYREPRAPWRVLIYDLRFGDFRIDRTILSHELHRCASSTPL